MIELTHEARLLLLWCVAREAGLVPKISASHEPVLFPLGDLYLVHKQLHGHGFLTSDNSSYETTEAGRAYLRRGM